MSETVSDKAQGVMVGVAVGDLLGAPFEGFDISCDPSEQELFAGWEQIDPSDRDNAWKRGAALMIREIRDRSSDGLVTSYVGEFGTGFWNYGQTTDDSFQTVLVAESLVECAGFDPEDQAKRLVRWYNGGLAMGLGGTTALSLMLLDPAETDEPYAWNTAGAKARELTESSPYMYAGRHHKKPYGIRAVPSNGALMRTGPLGVFFRDPAARMEATKVLCRITHDFDACVDTALMQTSLIADFMEGASVDEAIESATQDYPETYEHSMVSLETAEGHVGGAYTSMGIALDALSKTSSFRDAIVSAINSSVLREPWMVDVDTYGAIVGALAGARYGFSEIPTEWYELPHPNGVTYDLTPHAKGTLASLGRQLLRASGQTA